jgi:hypothetical protein
MCTFFPGFADYMGMLTVGERSVDLILQRDRFAVERLTEAFSDPVQLSIMDNGGILYLVRVWKAGHGYIVLTTGRDPRNYEIFLRWVNEKPEIWGPFERGTDMTAVTRTFLDGYEVVFVPIGSQGGLKVEQTASSCTMNGRQVEVGAGQPATRFNSDSEGADKPQPEAEGRSR